MSLQDGEKPHKESVKNAREVIYNRPKAKQIFDDFNDMFYDTSPVIRYTLVAIPIILLLGFGYLFIKWAFLDKPNSYEWHYKQSEQALTALDVAESYANPVNADGQTIVSQIRNNKTGVINGVKLDTPTNQQRTTYKDLSVKAAKDGIKAVQDDNARVAAAGGMATLEQVQQTYNNNPSDPIAALKVQRTLQDAGINTGVNVNAGLTEAQLGAAALTSY